MIQFIRSRFKLVCLICFLLTTGAGLIGVAKPGLVLFLAGLPPMAGLEAMTGARIFIQFGFLLVAIVGLWFLIIMMNPEANRPLLVLAVAEKLIFVAFFVWAISAGRLGILFIGIALGDMLMGLACLVYLILGESKPAIAS